MVALVTPMHADGSIDQESLFNLVDWHLESKTKALVIAGTTGEAPTLTTNEQFELLSEVVRYVRKKIPVIAGTGGNSTQHVIELTTQAKEVGAEGALIVTPYYNKPTQPGLFEHFKTIAHHVALPIILYNVPARTGCDLLPETIVELAKISNIIGIKEATGKIERTEEIISYCGGDFPVYSGDDASNFELIKKGAKGVISVTANILPRKMHDFCEAALNGNLTLAETLDAELMPLHKGLFFESNPIPVKWALQQMKRISTGIRLPLVNLTPKYHQSLRDLLNQAGLLTVNNVNN